MFFSKSLHNNCVCLSLSKAKEGRKSFSSLTAFPVNWVGTILGVTLFLSGKTPVRQSGEQLKTNTAEAQYTEDTAC